MNGDKNPKTNKRRFFYDLSIGANDNNNQFIF
jgi:hypothetical protein